MGLLEGKCALITGGTTGLGLAIAGRFRREGARVVITGRDHDLGGQAERTLGPGVRFVAADAADPRAVASSVRAAADHLGGLDVLWGSRTGPLWLTWAFYAARSYSLRRPPSTGRRLTRTWERSATG